MMFSEIEIIVLAILSFCVGVGFTIVISLIHRKELIANEAFEDSAVDLRKKVMPFIHIHESLLSQEKSAAKGESIRCLQSKIESFKERNRFYQS